MNGIFGREVIRKGAILSAVAFLCAQGSATNIALYNSYAGNINFVSAGGTLRTADDVTNACSVTTGTVSAAVSGIPAGSTIVAALLYYAGSGSTIDSAVTFNGNAVTADRTFTETFNNGTAYNFFGGFKNVTSFVTGNGTYTFGGLTVDTTTTYCSAQAVLDAFAVEIIYANPTENFRVINVYDGMQQFHGSSITLTPSNFNIPSSPVNGKISIVTWEGDLANSDPLSGFTENVAFNGNSLTDAGNPAANQFNSTINTYGTANTYYGVDVDTYDVSSYIAAGQTSATTVYASGSDLVLLGAQIISITNTPSADLGITKTHTGNFSVGANGVYSIGVSNSGPSASNATITISDTLPTGLTFVSGTGTGWSCSASGQVVTCAHTGIVASGTSAPTLSLTVAVGPAAYPSIANTASVTSATFDNTSANNSATDTATVLAPDFSTSIKTVVDQNGGEPNVGDVLRYTITAINTVAAAAVNVTITDDIPANVTGFTVVSVPSGSTNSSTGTGTGANSNGLLTVTGISVPANGSVTLVFDVTIATGTAPGTLINNTASITPTAGVSDATVAPSVTVSPSLIPTTGTKVLYLDGTNLLSRKIPTNAAVITTIAGGATSTFALASNVPSQATTASMILGAGTISIPLRLARGTVTGNRTIKVSLVTPAGSLTQTQTVTLTTAYTTITFTLTLAADTTVAAATNFQLQINNTSAATATVLVKPLDTAIYSRVILNSKTVINVNSINTYSAVYPSTTAATPFGQSQIAYVRAVISDPWGTFDITSASTTITRSNGTVMLTAAAMTQVADSGVATKTYEYQYTVPVSALGGFWDTKVTAKEGTENTISDTGDGTFLVQQAIPNAVKTSTVFSDPIRGTSNPKRIPGAVVRYQVLVSNQGKSSPDASTLVLTDPVDTSTQTVCVSTLCSGGSDPVIFTNGSPTSGLTYTYASAVTYSNQVGGGAPYTYTPVGDASGYDAAVTGLRVAPGATMNPSTGSAPYPSFTVTITVKVD